MDTLKDNNTQISLGNFTHNSRAFRTFAAVLTVIVNIYRRRQRHIQCKEHTEQRSVKLRRLKLRLHRPNRPQGRTHTYRLTICGPRKSWFILSPANSASNTVLKKSKLRPLAYNTPRIETCLHSFFILS